MVIPEQVILKLKPQQLVFSPAYQNWQQINSFQPYMQGSVFPTFVEK